MSEPTPSLLDAAGDPDELATRWFARRRSGRMSPREAADLETWLARDPANRAAFDAVEFTWRAADVLRTDPDVLALREAAMRPQPLRRPRLVFGAMAASLCLVVAGGWAAVGSGALSNLLVDIGVFPGMHDQEFRTGVGQRATVKLPDGSTVTLNTDTVLRTRAARDRRLVYLDRGQAYFRVAHDRARPFIVTAAGRTVTAVGTAFDVRVDARLFQVTLVEGKVRVETPIQVAAAAGRPRPAPSVQVTEMTAGSQLAAADGQHWSLTSANVAKETGWLRGQLIFEREPLGEVAAELNRYSTKKIVIRDPKVAATPVTAAFKAGDVDGFVRAVEDYHFARIAADGDASVELAAPS